MDRRFFIKNVLSASVSLALVSSLKHIAYSHPQTISKYNKRSLVLIQLDGGNDGLNTFIPIDQYAHLLNARKNILIPENKILQLNNAPTLGLHPAFAEIQKLYNEQKITIVQSVGYPNPDLSHFNAIDIWQSGFETPYSLPSGWIGRFLEENAISSANEMNDPPAIQVNGILSKALQGSTSSKGIVVKNTSNFYDIVLRNYETAPQTEYGKQLSYLRTTTKESKAYLDRVKMAAHVQKNLSKKYPPIGENPLSDQLRIVAQLIGGGLQTKVYVVNLKGFDTHDRQVEASDTTKGSHANLLSQLSIAIAAFEEDLSLMNIQDQVLGMTFSEFGRRIRSNASYGCDHGTAAPLLLFGTQLKHNIVGNNPQISEKTSVNDFIPFQHDFRSLYASILKDWFGVNEKQVDKTLYGQFPTLDLFKV